MAPNTGRCGSALRAGGCGCELVETVGSSGSIVWGKVLILDNAAGGSGGHTVRSGRAFAVKGGARLDDGRQQR